MPQSVGNCTKAIPDTDVDGVIDLVDIDDDNDGVLDVLEVCTFEQISKTGVTASSTLTGITILSNASETTTPDQFTPKNTTHETQKTEVDVSSRITTESRELEGDSETSDKNTFPGIAADKLVQIDTPNFPADLLSFPSLNNPEMAKLLGQWIGHYFSLQKPPQDCCGNQSGLKPLEQFPTVNEAKHQSDDEKVSGRSNERGTQEIHKPTYTFSHQGQEV